jgi:TRAP-type C4-dicarboxylate transport system substrate-binding protein
MVAALATAIGTVSLLAAELTIRSGLADYQAYQRDSDGNASVSFAGTVADGATGRVECMVIAQRSGATLRDWEEVGACRRGQVEGTIRSLPTGGPYAILLRVVAPSGKVIAGA